MDTINITMHAIFDKEGKINPCQYQEKIALIRSRALCEDWSTFVRGLYLIQDKSDRCSRQLEVQVVYSMTSLFT